MYFKAVELVLSNSHMCFTDLSLGIRGYMLKNKELSLIPGQEIGKSYYHMDALHNQYNQW